MKRYAYGAFVFVFSLRRAERRLCAQPREELTPAGQWIRDNARALYLLARTPFGPLPSRRLAELCQTLAEDAAGPLREAALCREIGRLQGEEPLTVAELRALPDALRYALLARLRSLLPRVLRENEKRQREQEPIAVWRACLRLVEAGRAEELRALESGLRARGLDPRELNRQARQALEETAAQVSAAVNALLSLSRLDGARITEKCSAAARLLADAPVWRDMDRESRGMYLTAVSRLHKRLGVGEEEICRAARTLAGEGDPGLYLLGEQAPLRRALGRRPGMSQKGRVRLYFLFLLLAFALSLAAGLLLLSAYGAVPFAFAGSGLIHGLLERLAPRLLPRRLLPRLRPDRLPAGTRALVAVPTVLPRPADALRMCRKLSVLYLADPQAPVDFALVCDFADADGAEDPGDAAVIRAAAAGVRALRQAYGDRFYYLQRARSENADGRFSGRERKRGALGMLNDLLITGKTADPLAHASIDPARLARRYTHVITLDADTFLPAGAAEKLLGAITHPLQAGRVAVIQPRMLTLAAQVTTRAQLLLGGRSGADGYGLAAADLYQDAFGRGSFQGKGIYAVEAFREAAGDLPPGRILSHDLLEGELAGSALASDIVCYDGHPRRVEGFLRRAHRWIRGDWQLLPFLFDRRLDLLSRIKLWDNLRRSLTPAFRLIALLVSSWLAAPLPFLLCALPITAEGLFLLPAFALNGLDAAGRALWRLLISKRRLLEWTPAAQAEESDLRAFRGILLPMLCAIGMLFAAARTAFWPGFALGAAWLAAPLIARWLDGPLQRQPALSPRQAAFLRGAALDTFSWFEARVNADTHFLPPDNDQLSPDQGVDLRTSPTNIGLYFLSLCAARALGFLGEGEMLRRMARSLDSLERMSLWHGVPYNWYSLRDLTALPPRVVSSVDAGNCLLCLAAAAQAARNTGIPSDVPARLDALCAGMRLQRLYDRSARLFYVSIEGDTGRPSAGHYDLLASEAQLLSFAAVLYGAAPELHWWQLARPWAAAPRRLMSWSGTMFEYMMAALLLPAAPGTLLSAARKGCVAAQRRAGREGLFGVSESGCASLDAQLRYRYRAFGVRALALDAEARGDVYAPYAVALALREAPEAACRALERMKRLGAYDRHGFLEAIDCSGGSPRLVMSHMAHHQGMLLCALCNALCGDALPALVLQLPRAQAHLPLLCELPPRRVRRLPRPLRGHRDTLPEPPVRIRADAALPADAVLLSGGGASLLLNARGHGWLFAGELSLTRFDPRVEACSGPQLYLAEEGMPPRRLLAGDCTWLEGAARFALQEEELRAEVTVCLDPLTGAAVYRARLRNLSRRRRALRLVFYLEPALERQRDDMAHIAFSNLFISVRPEGAGGLLARRQLREGGERTLRLRAYGEMCEYTDDRAAFFTREGTADAPLGLLDDWKMTGSAAVCAALRVPVSLQPGGEDTLCFAAGQRLPETLAAALEAEGLAAARSRVSRRLLGMEARHLSLCARLAGALLYRSDAPAPSRLPELWALGISGDAPILAVSARSEEDLPALRLVGRLHRWLCENGAESDLIFLLPEEAGYLQPLRAFCDGLSLPRTRILTGQALPRAAVRLDAGQPLADQLIKQPQGLPLIPAAPGGSLPALPRLRAYNGYGGFTPEGGYAVCRTAPRPWCHILSGERFGTLVCEQGILYSFAGNSRLRRLTRVSQDSVLTEPAEEYLLLENGKAWSLTRRPLMNAPCRAVYEMGAAVFSCAVPGLQAEITCFADPREVLGGRLLRLRNTGAAPRTVTVRGTAHFALGENAEGTHAVAGTGRILARGDLEGLAFYALRGSRARAEGASGALEADRTLQPGETATLCFWLGHCDREEAADALLAGLSPLRERQTRAAWRDRLGGLQFYLPDPLLSMWLNGFLPYQIRAARLEGRLGFYQSGGAWGFRDQLQDMLSLLYTEPERVRAHLLRCASRQYREGDVQHWWHPEGPGVRTHISDDRLFLPWVTARYVHVTGDAAILEEAVPFLDSPPLAEGQRDRYETADISPETASLREHCLRAIGSLRLGAHGIPLMEGGDWNDGMNDVGGESVWLGFFLLMVLRDFAPLCDGTTQDAFDRRRIALRAALGRAWTGQWFLRAWYRDGRSLGGPDSPVPRIDLISQCFAAFAGMPRDQAQRALDAAWDRLHRPENGVTLLLSPPFSPEEKAGYIGAYNPGARENGGQYTHALPWFMRALLMHGQTGRAWQLLSECLPFAHSGDQETARHYGAEPYALAADIRPDGRAGWTWYTGSAGWLYEVFLHDFMGFDKKGDGVRLSPRAPAGWEEVTLLYRFGGSRYQLTARRDAPYITLDGEKMTGAYVPLRDDGRAHEIRFPMPPANE